MGIILDELRKKNAKTGNKLIGGVISNIGYPTKLLPLDFRNGYQVDVFDPETNQPVDKWANIGIFGGTFVTVCGKSGTAKTAFCVQACAEICRKYDQSEIYHIDAEGSSNISRLSILTKYSIKEMMEKYKYIEEVTAIEDIFDLINSIAEIKLSNREAFTVQTTKRNEFGEYMQQLAPTCVIIDSIPMLITKELEEEKGMASQTYSNRLAKVISQFYKRLRPVIKKANIIVFVINHLNAKIDINPMQKTQAQLMYLKSDESMPGGNAPIYLAQTVFKFVTCGKYTDEKDGFNGFQLRVEFLKSKTNRAGSSCTIVYDMNSGFDYYRTILEFCKEKELVEGRNPYCYFRSNPDLKFNTKNFSNLCMQDPAYFKEALECAKFDLYSYLASSEDLVKIAMEEAEINKRLSKTYMLEGSEDEE